MITITSSQTQDIPAIKSITTKLLKKKPVDILGGGNASEDGSFSCSSNDVYRRRQLYHMSIIK